MSIAIDDERALSKEMFVLGVGGMVAGLSAAGLSLVVGEYVPQLMALTFAAVVGLFANYSDGRSERGHFRLGVSILGGIVWALLMAFSAVGAAVVGGVILGASLYVAAEGEGAGRVRRLGVWGLYGVALGLGVFTTQTFLEIGFLEAFRLTAVPEVVMGTVWGVFMCAAALVSRVEVRRDLMVDAYRRAIAEVGVAERTLLSRGLMIYSEVMAELRRSEHRELVEVAVEVADEISGNLLKLARKTDALRRGNVVDDFLYLEGRIARVDEQLKVAQDVGLQRELQEIRQELSAQLEVRWGLRATCARFEARQHRCVTALERLQVALIQNSALGSLEPVGLQDALGNLQSLSEEISWRGGWEQEEEQGFGVVGVSPGEGVVVEDLRFGGEVHVEVSRGE